MKNINRFISGARDERFTPSRHVYIDKSKPGWALYYKGPDVKYAEYLYDVSYDAVMDELWEQFDMDRQDDPRETTFDGWLDDVCGCDPSYVEKVMMNMLGGLQM